MKRNRRLGALAVLALLPGAAYAQDTSDLAKQAQNPISSLISVPFQGNYDCCYGPNQGGRWTTNIQPVVPIKIGDDWNLIVRTIVPLVDAQAQSDAIGRASGLGDTTQSFFLSPQRTGPSGIIWGVGPVFVYPTATNQFLGARRWGAGATAVVLKQESGWTYGVLANHIWSIGDADPGKLTGTDISNTFVQPFLSYTTPSGFATAINTESSYNWLTHQWTVPINLLFSQVFKIGDQPVQFQAGPRYYLEAPPNGPRWGARFNLTFLFPGGSASHEPQAAALPVKAAPSAPPPWRWTGFHVGVNAGYGSGQSDTGVTFVNAATGAAIIPPAGSVTGRLPDLSGFIAGGQVGYDIQAASRWVYGIEGDMQWANQRGSTNYLCGAPAAVGAVAPCLAGATSFPAGTAGTSLTTSQKLEWFGTVRGRAGLLISPTALGYITGGLAFGSVSTSGMLGSFNSAQAPVATLFSGSEMRAGWTIGTGLEARLAGTAWTFKVEYLYIDLGEVSASVAQAVATGVPIGANLSSRVADNLIRVGGNYKF